LDQAFFYPQSLRDSPEGHAEIASAISGGLFAFPYFASQNTRPGHGADAPRCAMILPQSLRDSPEGHDFIMKWMESQEERLSLQNVNCNRYEDSIS